MPGIVGKARRRYAVPTAARALATAPAALIMVGLAGRATPTVGIAPGAAYMNCSCSCKVETARSRGPFRSTTASAETSSSSPADTAWNWRRDLRTVPSDPCADTRDHSASQDSLHALTAQPCSRRHADYSVSWYHKFKVQRQTRVRYSEATKYAVAYASKLRSYTRLSHTCPCVEESDGCPSDAAVISPPLLSLFPAQQPSLPPYLLLPPSPKIKQESLRNQKWFSIQKPPIHAL